MKAIDSPAALTRAILAMQAVSFAKAFLPLIRMQEDERAGAALYGALCVYYARAFTNNKGLGQLSPKVVPHELRETHDKLLEYRHKIAAHSDSAHQHEGVDVNAVYFRSNGRSLLVEDRHLCPTTDFLRAVEELLIKVVSQLSDAVGRCLNSGPPSRSRFPEGLYQLRGESEQDWTFVPVPDDGLDAERT